MLKKRASMPVEIQPVSDQRAQAILMGSSTSKKTKRSSNSPQSRKSSANAEASRRSSLREQRTQLENEEAWLVTGENSVVAAGAVVTKGVPPSSFVAGIPAKVIRSLGESPGA